MAETGTTASSGAAGLSETPRGDRTAIAVFGLRNAGKSTLVNALTGQRLAIVSDVPGTTTDPVSKAMEILPLGPCLVTDTAGLDDDDGALGAARVAKTRGVLAATDIAVWVSDGADSPAERTARERFLKDCAARGVPTLTYVRGEDVNAFRARLAALRPADEPPPLLAGLVGAGETVVCVCPLDGSAPKGRLILPQVQTLRAILEAGAVATVCQPEGLPAALAHVPEGSLVITDSQVFGLVKTVVSARGRRLRLTSFSLLFARQKGDLETYCAGVAAIAGLRDGDTVLVCEGCTHHRQCEDIGTVKIPKALTKLSGRTLCFAYASGRDFPDLAALPPAERPALVVHCGGCMLTRREVRARIARAAAADVPITNYGLLLARAAGIVADAATCTVVTEARP